MEIENQGTGSPADGGTPTPPPSTIDTTPPPTPAGSENTPPPADAPPAYQPNFKYKFNDEEREIDPFFRALIKDADSEKKVREIFQLADALPKYKEKLTTTEQRLQTLEPEHTKLTSALQQLGKYRNEGDWDSFFTTLKVPEKELFKYVAQRLQYQDLPEDQRRVYDQNRELKSRAENAEAERLAYERDATNGAIQARSFQLDQGLAKAEVKQISDAVDAIQGAGSFRKRVIEIGRLAASDQQPRDLSAEEAISAAVKSFEAFVKRPAQQGGNAPEAPKQPVIPNVAGTANAPAKRVVKSMADIEARKKELGIE